MTEQKQNSTRPVCICRPTVFVTVLPFYNCSSEISINLFFCFSLKLMNKAQRYKKLWCVYNRHCKNKIYLLEKPLVTCRSLSLVTGGEARAERVHNSCIGGYTNHPKSKTNSFELDGVYWTSQIVYEYYLVYLR